MLKEMAKENVRYAIMEVSSHALDQERTRGINFHSAIFTNLTQDHLDYHLTLENYFQAKAKLFKNIGENHAKIKAAPFAVVNQDDPYGRRIKELTAAELITYGIDNKADIMAKDIKLDIAQTEFLLTTQKQEAEIKTSLIGRHNVYNVLAAITWGLKAGLDLAAIKASLRDFRLVPGRLEKIEAKGKFLVFVDYAHTEDALSCVLKALRQLSKNRVIVVFGCGGERDRTKRPKMGRVVSELADFAIITNDNPRSEEPQSIIEEIKKGIAKDNYCVIAERKEAIRKSLSLAKSGDIVLVAGKGHENYQIINNQVMPFNDCQVVKECLRSMNY
jgi:UDP-N-acetylmuramoyl-L-alanyl-D-glutamate--2,6-diaminopimelate ligase